MKCGIEDDGEALAILRAELLIIHRESSAVAQNDEFDQRPRLNNLADFGKGEGAVEENQCLIRVVSCHGLVVVGEVVAILVSGRDGDV